ncbi:MAG: hypothetical protein J7513_13930 [Solirubrobacteraceae bacterium]|nr:hypothetical protein [Solirubrobacteraceae bacterium]
MTRRRTSRFALALLSLAFALGFTVPAANAAVETFTYDDVPTGEIPMAAGSNHDNYGPYYPRGLITPWQGCMTTGVYSAAPGFAYSGNQFLMVSDQDACGGNLNMAFFDPVLYPTTIQFAVRGQLSASLPSQVTIQAYGFVGASTTQVLLETRTITFGTGWQVVTFRAPAGNKYSRLAFTTGPAIGPVLLVDQVRVSVPRLTPTVTFGSIPATTSDTKLSVPFTPNADAERTVCSLDGAPAQPCSSPVTYEGLALGAHEVKVTAYDTFGFADPNPPVARWNVVPVPTPTPTPDPCLGGPDSDGDGINDACDTVGLPATAPSIAGVQAKTVVLSGEVFVKLPGASGASAKRLAEPGFVPLKGTAVLPVGSTVDTRAGDVQVVTATGATAKGAPTRATSRVAAAIFQIRQRRAARRAKGSKKKLPPSPTQLILRNATGAVGAARCDVKGSRGVVRSLSATIPKGIVQVSGSAAQVTATKANTTMRIVDRCDGTFAEVGAGALSLRDTRRHKTVRVTRGRSYFVPGKILRPKGN